MVQLTILFFSILIIVTGFFVWWYRLFRPRG